MHKAVLASTTWAITPSLLCDLVCFAAIVAGDPEHQALHGEACQLFLPKLDPVLIARIRPYFDPPQVLLSAELFALSFIENGLEGTHLSSPPHLPAPTPLIEWIFHDRARLWEQYRAAYADTTVLLQRLLAAGFADYWSSLLPSLQARANELHDLARSCDVMAQVAALLGRVNNKPSVTLYLCWFAVPHSFRLFGEALVTDASSSPAELVAITIHELLHPPCRKKTISELTGILRQDTFFMSAFENQPAAYAYSLLEDFVEENVVMAGQVLAAVNLGLSVDPLYYFRRHNRGSHVFAPILFEALWLNRSKGWSLEQGVLALIGLGKLHLGGLKSLHEASLEQIADLSS